MLRNGFLFSKPQKALMALFFSIALCTAMLGMFRTGTEEVHAAGEAEAWHTQQSGVTTNLNDVCFVDGNHGWAVGDGGLILFYNGKSWTKQQSPTTYRLIAVSAAAADDVWAIANAGGGDTNAYLYIYHYDGTSWKLQSDRNISTTGETYDIAAYDADHAWIVGWDCTAAPYATIYTYNGWGWSSNHYCKKGMNGLWANDPAHLWAVADEGYVFGNGGGNWYVQRQGGITRHNLYGVSATPDNHVVAVGGSGSAIIAPDGKDWISGPDTTTSKDLLDVVWVDTGHCWAVGKKGTIIFNNDLIDAHPMNWYQQGIGLTSNDLNGIAAVDNNHVWAVGNGGTILKYSPAPKIVGCSPSSVMAGDTVTLEITGSNTNFVQGQSVVTFNPGDGISIKNTSVTNFNHVSATISVAKDAYGPRDVNVKTGTEVPTALENGLTITGAPKSPPELDRIGPQHGDPGIPVVLEGKDFGAIRSSKSKVTFNGTPVNDFEKWSDRLIVCRVPGGATSGPVVVTTLLGDSNPLDFTVDSGSPAIIDCSPNAIHRGGSAEVTIKGQFTHFAERISNATFDPPDGITVHSTRVLDSSTAVTSITASDDAPLGFRAIDVTTGPEHPRALSGCFIVQPHRQVPRLDSVSPDRGAPGDTVVLTGEFFYPEKQDSSCVSFNGTLATDYTSWSNSVIECAVPQGATTGPVFVQTLAGTSGGKMFTVGEPYIEDCHPEALVQGHQIDDFHVLGDYTHFQQGESAVTVSGDGITVVTTTVDDPAHATSGLQVALDASPGPRDVNVITGDEAPIPLSSVFTVYQKPPSPPDLSSISPISGPVGTTVYVFGANFGHVRGSSSVTFGDERVSTYVSWSDHEIVCKVPFGASTGNVKVVTPWGTSNRLHFAITEPTFYFAEGTCRPGFDPYFCIQNPEDGEAEVKITYMKGDGTTTEQLLNVPARYRFTVAAKDTLDEGDDAAHDFSAKVVSTNGEPILVERPMYFDYKGEIPGGSDVIGALSPARCFYFAEGTCRPGFIPYFTIQNPGQTAAEVKITYMKGDGANIEQELVVPATTRSTVAVEDALGKGDDAAHDFSAKVESTNGVDIVAERPMYFDYGGNWPGGHDVMGALSPAKTFYFAEGSCRPAFDPYFTIKNPGAADAQVVITYLRGDGTMQQQSIIVVAQSRSTVNAKDFLGEADSPAYDFSAKIESKNNVNIVAERPMYFDYKGEWTGGHNVVGALSPAKTFYFAEGSCRLGFDTYLCIGNPSIANAEIKITYTKGDGINIEKAISVGSGSRETIMLNDFIGSGIGESYDCSLKVESANGVSIVCERPMYFDYLGIRTGGHDVVGFAP